MLVYGDSHNHRNATSMKTSLIINPLEMSAHLDLKRQADKQERIGNDNGFGVVESIILVYTSKAIVITHKSHVEKKKGADSGREV